MLLAVAPPQVAGDRAGHPGVVIHGKNGRANRVALLGHNAHSKSVPRWCGGRCLAGHPGKPFFCRTDPAGLFRRDAAQRPGCLAGLRRPPGQARDADGPGQARDADGRGDAAGLAPLAPLVPSARSRAGVTDARPLRGGFSLRGDFQGCGHTRSTVESGASRSLR